MSLVSQTVVRGAAVVIDDDVDHPDAALQEIFNQLDAAEVPTIKLKDLPTIESLVHWKRFGLIVLDWELAYASAEEGMDIPAGVGVPSVLGEDALARNLEFVTALLDLTSLPIFIASNGNVAGIESKLEEHLASRSNGVRDRMKVFSKGELHGTLFELIGKWIESKTSLVALRAWGMSYIDAEVEVFNRFAEQDEDWVLSIARAAEKDNASVDATLVELLIRNITNRIQTLNLKIEVPDNVSLTDATPLRHVLHMSAVVPASTLDEHEYRTGDMFVKNRAKEPYEEIRIIITPDCDLLRTSRCRLTYALALRKISTRSAENRAIDVGKPSPLHLTNSLLTDRGDEYDIPLKDWGVGFATANENGGLSWRGYKRIGRLLDPYITQIQQNIALTSIRKGLPKLPEDFFKGWT